MLLRCEGRQVFNIGVFGSHVGVARATDAVSGDFVGLHLGHIGLPVYPQCTSRRLYRHATGYASPRKVRHLPCHLCGAFVLIMYMANCRLTSVLSMNAAISSSVVLASRLPSDLSVFGLMLVSVQLFALFPMLRRRLQVMPIFLSPVRFTSADAPAPGRTYFCSDVRHARTVPVGHHVRRVGITHGDRSGCGSVRSRHFRGTGRPRVGAEIQEVCRSCGSVRHA